MHDVFALVVSATEGVTHEHAAISAETDAPEFPRKADFTIEDGYTYINAAYTHPMPTVAREAVQKAAESRATLRAPTSGSLQDNRRLDPKVLFADLIGAKASEIVYVPSTSFGGNLVVQSLGLHKKFDGNVVSDGLHFEGALMHCSLRCRQLAPLPSRITSGGELVQRGSQRRGLAFVGFYRL